GGPVAVRGHDLEEAVNDLGASYRFVGRSCHIKLVIQPIYNFRPLVNRCVGRGGAVAGLSGVVAGALEVTAIIVTEILFRRHESFTQEEFRRWVEDRPGSDINHYELIDGRIVMEPPAGWPHGRIGSILNRLLDAHVRGNNLGIVLDASAGFDLPSGDT